MNWTAKRQSWHEGTPEMADEKTTREMMEELGWGLQVCDDTLATGWVKVRRASAGYEAVAYGGDSTWDNDLGTCQSLRDDTP